MVVELRGESQQPTKRIPKLEIRHLSRFFSTLSKGLNSNLNGMVSVFVHQTETENDGFAANMDRFRL